jgi:hypothetical protein
MDTLGRVRVAIRRGTPGVGSGTCSWANAGMSGHFTAWASAGHEPDLEIQRRSSALRQVSACLGKSLGVREIEAPTRRGLGLVDPALTTLTHSRSARSVATSCPAPSLSAARAYQTKSAGARLSPARTFNDR